MDSSPAQPADPVRTPVASGGPGRLMFALEVLWVRLRFVALMVATGLLVGYWDHIQNWYDRRTRPAVPPDLVGAIDVEFFCPMHPKVIRDAPGNCPICGMPLSKRRKGVATALPPGVLTRVQLSPYRVRMAGIATSEVGYEFLVKEIRNVGLIEFDERKVARVSARVAGRIDRLDVNFTGTVVKAGQTIGAIYSPELLATEEELLLAGRREKEMRAVGAAGGLSSLAGVTPDGLATSARRRLHLWGMSDDQIARVIAGGTARTEVEIESPLQGTVVEKDVVAGQYVAEGSPIVTVVDMSSVWLFVPIYEDEIDWIKPGQLVEVVPTSRPDRVLVGTIAFIEPTLDRATRTVRARVDIPNEEGLLRPGMYVTATVRIPLGKVLGEAGQAGDAGGTGVAVGGTGAAVGETGVSAGASAVTTGSAAARKVDWTCPMHSQVSMPGPGKCPICAMSLVRREVLSNPRLATVCSIHPDTPLDPDGSCPRCRAEHIHLGATGKEESIETGFCCPVHPQKVGTRAGPCPVCGTECRLMTVEKTLAVPESAVIDTGTRKVVYVQSAPGTFDGKEVKLLPRVGTMYPIASGLSAGDRVATAGAFLIDAENRLNPAAGAIFFGASGTRASSEKAEAGAGGSAASVGSSAASAGGKVAGAGEGGEGAR